MNNNNEMINNNKMISMTKIVKLMITTSFIFQIFFKLNI